jgi:hypothetical protein
VNKTGGSAKGAQKEKPKTGGAAKGANRTTGVMVTKQDFLLAFQQDLLTNRFT